MANLRDYTVNVNGNETVLSLTDEDAQRLGGVPVDSGGGRREPEAKARTTSNKARASAGEKRE